jgi:DNA-binding response OmpR family regulator
MRILVVEDERRIAAFIKQGLEEESYVVDVAYDGIEALDWAAAVDYQLVLLDVLLPRKDGIEVCRELRAQGSGVPILMLTARDAVEDRVHGLDSGADDYLVKPFAFQELLARVRALLRRRGEAKTARLQVGDLILDTLSRQASRGGRIAELSAREYALLEFLMRHPGQVLGRTQIMDHVWGYDFVAASNVVDVYIGYLRRKIDDGFGDKLIHTVRGAGYKIEPGS